MVMTGLAPGDDFTSQIRGNLGIPIAIGSFGVVYRCTVRSSIGIGGTEVAVKAFRTDGGRTIEKLTKSVNRELAVWLRLKHPMIVPLLGTAQVGSPLPALVSQWMSSGTLFQYLDNEAAAITFSARIELVEGIAKGLHYLHSENVVHGDLHPGNVLIDDLGNPRLTDFGLATVAEVPELQLGMTTLGHNFDPRWRAPEVIGIDSEPTNQTFKGDVYSFGSITFFVWSFYLSGSILDFFCQIVSGDIPWKEKTRLNIHFELSKRATPAHPHNVCDYHWDFIQKCWCWEPECRPEATRVLQVMTEYREGTSASLRTESFTCRADTEERYSQHSASEFCTSPTLIPRSRLLDLKGRIPYPSMVPASHKSELESLTGDNVLISEARDGRPKAIPTIILDPPKCPSLADVESTSSLYITAPNSLYETISSSSIGHELQPLVNPPANDDYKPAPMFMNQVAITSVPRPPPQFTPAHLPRENAISSPITLRPTVPTSMLVNMNGKSLSSVFNVFIFGETGVGKSSVINLIMGRNVARTSPDAQICTIEHTPYEISLGNDRFKLWEVPSTISSNFFWRLFAKWSLERAHRKMYRDDGVYLLLYCMRSSRAQTALVRDYKYFFSIFGSTASRVPVAAVVTCLEDYPLDMDEWWSWNEQDLRSKGMHFSKHACITSLPEDANASPALRARRRQSQLALRQLICDSYRGA